MVEGKIRRILSLIMGLVLSHYLRRNLLPVVGLLSHASSCEIWLAVSGSRFSNTVYIEPCNGSPIWENGELKMLLAEKCGPLAYVRHIRAQLIEQRVSVDDKMRHFIA